MAEKKLSYKEVPIALKYVIKTLWKVSPSYVLISIFYSLKDRLLPYVTLFIAASITSKLPALISHQINMAPVVRLLVILFAIEVVSLLIDLLAQNKQQVAEAMVSIELREHFYRAYARLPYYLYEDKKVIDAFQYADQFMYRFSQFGLNQLVRALGSALEIVTATVAMVAVAWYMPLLFILSLPFLVRSLLSINQEQAKIYYHNRPLQRRVWAIESLFYPRRIKETRLYGVVEHFLKDRRENSEKMKLTEQAVVNKQNRLSFWQDTQMQIAGLIATLIAVWRIAYHGAPLGIFVLAQQLTSRAGAAVKSLFDEISKFDQDLYGFAEYRYITEELQPGFLEKQTPIASPDISLSGVNFRYPETSVAVIKNVSIEIPYGSSIAIVGENGAGKTTLTKLLLGLYKPNSGQISVNAQNLEQIEENSWLSQIGVLLQDFGMNEDITIREAVWLGDISKPKDDQLISNSLAEAGLLERVEALPHGLNSYLGKWMDEEKGVELSGGELQRLAIARVLIRDPSILILDEPTSSIDANAEEEIFRKLMLSRKNKTTIFISHRFSTVRRAEKIIFMENGKVIEQGSHKELIALKGKYYKMFTTQAEGYR